MVGSNDETFKFHRKSKGICMYKKCLDAIWSKVDNFILKFFLAAPSKVICVDSYVRLVVVQKAIIEDLNKTQTKEQKLGLFGEI